ncbi:MAG TPA: alpha-ketoglutarate-dependent dioxygenase AlkB, partial [Acidimicrobiaceae bacterium]|nr:alpha-ketoglutarate-dependent dioxygenase AlkB [Acidimicrobiaceae bacterium]
MLQGTLFGTLPFGLADVSERVRRTMLDEVCWIDHVDGWVVGADDLYLELRRT